MPDGIIYDKCLGINNVDPSYRIGREFLTAATNINIDKTGRKSRRDGRTVALVGRFHSLWAGSILLGIYNNDLIKIIPGASYSIKTIKSSVGDFPMDFVEVSDRIYFTNDVDIGYITDEVEYFIPTPTTEFKMAMPPGHLIEYYRGVLYVAIGNLLVYSDAFSYLYDTRNDPLSFSTGKLRMLKAVNDGLYISDDRKVVFYSGRSPQKLEQINVSDVPATLGTAVSGQDETIMGEFYEHFVIWEADGIIFIGGNGGRVKDISAWYKKNKGSTGTGLLKTGDLNQYISITRGVAQEFDINLDFSESSNSQYISIL